jgi:hypothetical protein
MIKFPPASKKSFLRGLLPGKNIYILALLCILLLSLGLRLHGIKWGLPNENHLLSYHVDERNIYYAISNMNPSEFDFNLYLVLLILKSFGVNLAPTASSILIGRLITVFFGVMSVYILYLLGRELHNEELGLISSTILAITPLHVIHSHFLTTDVPVTFWILTSLLFSVKILNSGKTRWYILAGVTAGLGVSTKYNAGLIVFPILIAHILNRRNAQKTISILKEKNILLSFSLIIATLFVTSPYILLDFSEFKRDIILINIYLNTINPEWFDTGIGWIYHLKESLYHGFGLFLLSLSFLGIGESLWKRRTESMLILSFIIPYLFWVGNWQVRFARFILPLVPFLIIFSVIGLFFLWSKSRALGVLVFLGIFVYTTTLTVSYNRTFATEDPRDHASSWINDNVPPGSIIGLPSTFQYFTPPIDLSRFNLIFTRKVSVLKEIEADYYITSDLEYRVYIKTKKTIEKYPSDSIFLNYLFNSTDYRTVKTFKKDQKFLFIDLTREYLPHDMIYANPEIIIFERVKEKKI